MSATPAPIPEISGHPGLASWKRTTAESSSASRTTDVPSAVIGDVVPASGIGRMSTGTPARASASVASVISRSCCSGATVQSMVEKMGRSHSEAPAMASKISMSGAACAGSRTSSCTCFEQLASEIASISRPAVSGSRSRAEIDGHV